MELSLPEHSAEWWILLNVTFPLTRPVPRSGRVPAPAEDERDPSNDRRHTDLIPPNFRSPRPDRRRSQVAGVSMVIKPLFPHHGLGPSVRPRLCVFVLVSGLLSDEVRTGGGPRRATHRGERTRWVLGPHLRSVWDTVHHTPPSLVVCIICTQEPVVRHLRRDGGSRLGYTPSSPFRVFKIPLYCLRGGPFDFPRGVWARHQP